MTQSIPPPGRDPAIGQYRAPATAPAGRARGAPAPGYVRPLAGLATVIAIVGIVAVAVTLFRGGFTKSVPVTVVSPRAGLVMNPDAKVKMRGVQVGKVASIDPLPNGQAALHLAMNPSQLHLIPANVLVDIASSTVFGAKFVQLMPPDQPSAQSLRPGAVLSGEHVTVEINTVFQQLTSVLAKIEPAKLNQTLGALASAFNGRGGKIGQMLTDLDALLAELDPSMPTLRHDLAVTAEVANAYGDAAPDLLGTARNAIPVSQTIIDERKNLDALLLSSIGLADVGNDVLSTNRKPLTDVLHLFVPTTDLFNEYHEALTCGLAGAANLQQMFHPLQVPGINLLIGFDFGGERYRYPQDLPRVAAKGGPQCTDLPQVPFEGHSPFVVADTGANPHKYGNQRMVWDSDLIKQWLFGPIDGPPRNSAQITQPG